MIDLEKIEKEINILKDELYKKRTEYENAKESNLREQYGEDFGCHTCAYNCCVNVGDYHTTCVKGNCIYCNHRCDEYMPHNELSKYIEGKHYYDEETLDVLNDFLGVSDIIKIPELHKKALALLTLRDTKEN